MRIEALDLIAFGPFSERRIELAGERGAEAPGLCVVYGPNEAGKSSALRAIRALFYGIARQSEDDFIHRYADLRIGARLRFDDGVVADLIRRKGNQRTLTVAGPQGDELLARFEALVQSIPESLFGQFYGLDHRALALGSKGLLDDGGELGNALYGAGMGIASLRRVIDQLADEAAELFVPRGRIQRIPAAIEELGQIQKTLAQEALAPETWAAQAHRVAEQRDRLTAIDGRLEAARARLSRVRRVEQARQALAQAESERLQAQARITRESERLSSLVLAPWLLAEDERIEVLHQELSAHRKTREELPRREEALAQLEAQIADLELAIGVAGGVMNEVALRQMSERAPALRELVDEAARLEVRLEQAEGELREVEAEREQLGRRLKGESVPGEARASDAVDPGALERALGRAMKLGPIDARIAELERRRAAVSDALDRLADQLGVSPALARGLDRIALPTLDAVRRFARRADELAAGRERGRERLRRIREEQRQVAAQLEGLRVQGAWPSEEELALRRRDRDRLWGEIRVEWIERQAPREEADGARVAQAFEKSLRDADGVADRLRLEAERVARAGELGAQASKLSQALAEGVLDEQADAEIERALAVEWRAAWPAALGEPGRPQLRLEWRERAEELLALEAEDRALAEELSRSTRERSEAIESLRLQLGVEGARDGEAVGALEPWLERGEAERGRREARATARREQVAQRERLDEREGRLRHARDEATRAHARWTERWRAELAAVRLPTEMRPRDVAARLDTIHATLERRREAALLRRRVEKMRADAVRFEEDAARLVARCQPELADFGAEAAVLRLKRELDRAREVAVRVDALVTALREAREGLAETESRCADAVAALRAFETSGETGEGSDAASDDAALDLDRLRARIDALDAEVAELSEDRTDIAAELRSARDALERMDGHARNAEQAERAQGIAAQIHGDVVRYAELLLARHVLEAEIEAYRSRHQGPLLEQTGMLFRELSRGAYPSIRSDVGDDGKARLVAVHASGREVAVEGLSSGTRDQLFLALRLASLAASLERGEKMPLIADDVLIEFDDDRTRATLDVLARFGARTQILLFSHHRHVADAALALGETARVVSL